jgi:TPR repeat protein
MPALAQIAPFDDFQHSAKHYAPQAKAGDPVAQLYLGIAIEALGVNAAARYGAAQDWIAKAAGAGLPAAQLRFAQINLVSGDRTSAQKNLSAAAASGLAEAQFNLAVMAQEDGDKATAQRQYEAAARQGFGPAQFNLALMMLTKPDGNAPSALAWLILATEQNTPNAQAARDQVSAALTEDERAEAAQRAMALR